MKKLFYTSLLSFLIHSHAFAYDYTAEESYGDHHKQFYVGASVGLLGGDARDRCDDFDIDCTAWKALLGYRFNDTVSVEGSFHSLINGRSDKDYRDNDTSAVSLSVLTFMPLQGKIDAVDRMNLKDLRAFGRLGVAAWNTELDTIQVNSGTDFLLGGGLQMNVLDNLDVRGEIEYFGGDLNSTSYTAGLTYSTF